MPRGPAVQADKHQATKSGKSAGRRSNKAMGRDREHLRPEEVNRLIAAARKLGRHGERDALAILLAFRHGLRASELCELRWAQFDLDRRQMHVKRVKAGKPSTQPLPGDEVRALRKLQRGVAGDYVFANERGGPLDRSGFLKIVRRAGEEAGFTFPTHPHMLRHACGFYLANDRKADTRVIQDYLGHVSIQHTVGYTALREDKFKGLWD